MRILIIGGMSLIGPPLVRRLVARRHEVTVFHRGQTHADLPDSVRHITGDRHRLDAQLDDFRRLGPDVVVDMIAYTEDDAKGLVAAVRGVARRVVVLSSGYVYLAHGRIVGSEPGPILPMPLTEESPLRSVLFPYRAQAKDVDDFPYSYDKIPVERTVMAEPDLPATVLRLPMTYGPGDSSRRLSPYVKRMDEGRPAIRLDERFARWKSPRGYVENVAAAIALAVENERAAGRIYNIAEEPAFTEAEWVRRIGEAAGWQGEVATVPAGRIVVPYNVDQDLVMSSARIRRELGFVEPVDLDEGLRRTIAWERANPPERASDLGILDEEPEDRTGAGDVVPG